MERGDTTVIVDAKYKEHWEELSTHRWSDLEEELRERHRSKPTLMKRFAKHKLG